MPCACEFWKQGVSSDTKPRPRRGGGGSKEEGVTFRRVQTLHRSTSLRSWIVCPHMALAVVIVPTTPALRSRAAQQSPHLAKFWSRWSRAEQQARSASLSSKWIWCRIFTDIGRTATVRDRHDHLPRASGLDIAIDNEREKSYLMLNFIRRKRPRPRRSAPSRRSNIR